MKDIPKDILERASAGDVEAFEEIYRAAGSMVYNVALRITGNSADAEEVAQDVFMRIYHSLKDFQSRSSFKTWAYRITVNTAINRYRQSAREHGRRVDYENESQTFVSPGSTADAAIQNDNESRLNALLSALSPEHKACLVLREIQGLSYEEISAALMIPLNTVRSRLKRAREALLEKARQKGVAENALR